jgi:oxaloacetate decarboxylase alpha subunit
LQVSLGKVYRVPRLVDTTIRLLSQEPLAGKVPTAELLSLAEVLDKAGFACLEVSGGGVFDSAVRRGVESPWERIRALKSRTTTPLGLALRGRFLVGSRPVGGDFVRRFVASAAENGIDVFRLHDPLNDVSNLREAGEAIVGAGKEFHAGLVYSPGGEGAADALVEQARELPGLNATRALIHDPTGGLQPHEAGELVSRVAEASGLPVGFYCQGASGSGMADSIEAARAGADLIACAVYPLALSLHRVAGESLALALAGMGLDTGVDVDRLWEASDLVDEHIGDEVVIPHAPRLAVRAAEYDLPTGLVAALDTHLRAHAAGDRLLETLEELQTIRRETGWPPLAAPIGQILASQALIHVLSARRYGTVVDEFRDLVQGRYGSPPAKVDPTVARAVTLLSDGVPLDEDPPTAEDVRQEAEGLAASEEELVLIALFGEEAEALLRTIRARATRDDFGTPTLDQSREQRIRELVRIVQESGVAEVEIEDEGMRVSVRRTEERSDFEVGATPLAEDELADLPVLPAAAAGAIRVESPMVGVFYRAPEPGALPFVELGDVVVPGQTLCMLEAMKLFNELKADAGGRVTAIHADNGKPVEFGQLLFELEPIVGPPTL